LISAGIVEDLGHVIKHQIKSLVYPRDTFVSDEVSLDFMTWLGAFKI
jgi:hypothetical protein